VVIVPLAMLPSYEAWGNIAIGAPIVLRLLNGMFIGKKIYGVFRRRLFN